MAMNSGAHTTASGRVSTSRPMSSATPADRRRDVASPRQVDTVSSVSSVLHSALSIKVMVFHVR